MYRDAESGDSPHNDLAGVRLLQEFNLKTPYVKEVQLTEKIGTFLEANATKPGDIVYIAGFETPIGVKIQRNTNTMTQTTHLKVFELKLTDVTLCINKYVETYPPHYFNIVCGKMAAKNSAIPCTLVGSGMIAKINGEPYLMGVYSSNTQLSQFEGSNGNKKSVVGNIQCTSNDLIFFEKIGLLGRWGISHNFCDHELFMCKTNRCRPWNDICDGKKDCSDGSDESPKQCLNQKPKMS